MNYEFRMIWLFIGGDCKLFLNIFSSQRLKIAHYENFTFIYKTDITFNPFIMYLVFNSMLCFKIYSYFGFALIY